MGYHVLTADAMIRQQGGGSLYYYNTTPTPPLPIRILPDAWAEHGETPSDVRRPAMVNFLSDLDEIQC